MADQPDDPKPDPATVPVRSMAKRGGLFVTDAELIEKLGATEKIARDAIKALDSQRGSSFPQKSKLWGNRRYWASGRALVSASVRRCSSLR
jgi:hypothetical protein